VIKIKSTQLFCRYCAKFENARRAISSEEKYGRFCNGKVVFSKNAACEEWEVCKYIVCDRFRFRIEINACLSRFQNKVTGCRRCKQGKQIAKFI
jgi:hypothetical protein